MGTPGDPEEGMGQKEEQALQKEEQALQKGQGLDLCSLWPRHTARMMVALPLMHTADSCGYGGALTSGFSFPELSRSTAFVLSLRLRQFITALELTVCVCFDGSVR